MFVLHLTTLDFLISVRDRTDDKFLGHDDSVTELSVGKYFNNTVFCLHGFVRVSKNRTSGELPVYFLDLLFTK